MQGGKRAGLPHVYLKPDGNTFTAPVFAGVVRLPVHGQFRTVIAVMSGSGDFGSGKQIARITRRSGGNQGGFVQGVPVRRLGLNNRC